MGGACAGGDRMAPKPLGNNYAPQYAAILKSFMQVSGTGIHIAEIGILAGVGLAIWSELLPQATLHGFDLFLDNFIEELPTLIDLGAFSYGNLPKLHVYDQMTGTA